MITRLSLPLCSHVVGLVRSSLSGRVSLRLGDADTALLVEWDVRATVQVLFYRSKLHFTGGGIGCDASMVGSTTASFTRVPVRVRPRHANVGLITIRDIH